MVCVAYITLTNRPPHVSCIADRVVSSAISVLFLFVTSDDMILV
jgi:hypothetical protein